MTKVYNDKLLKIFMIIQPIIDIITSVMINEFNLSLSLGMILRFVFLIYALGYIFINKDKKIIIFVLIWLLYMGSNLIGNYFIKDNFNLFTQIGLLTKMFYFPMILLFWLLYFKNNKELDRRVFIYVALLVGLSLVISYVTKTAYCTYENHENCITSGIVAWFNSANEYGLILIALLGFCIIDYLKNTNVFNIIALLLTMFFLCILGTKASYVGVVGLMSVYIIYYLITCFNDIKQSEKIGKVACLVIALFGIFLTTKHLPIYTNLVANYTKAYNEAVSLDCNEEVCDFELKTEEEVTEEIKQEVTSSLVFNGRDDFVSINKTIYKESNLFGKLFGITTQGNYYDGVPYNHINERDFHDLVIYYGVLGFLVEMILPVYLLVMLFKKVIKNIKVLYDDEIIITMISVGLILFGSYLAGHCLFAPAVSIYLAYLIALFYKKVCD